VLWITALVAAAAACIDVRRREIPDAFPLALLACGLAGAGLGAVSWSALAAGAALGAALGVVLFALGAFGGGDAKLLAGIGACLGPLPLLGALVPIGVAGGLLAVVALVRGARELAYAPAMATGLLAHAAMSQWASA